MNAYIGTRAGVHRLRDGRVEPGGLEREDVTAIHVQGDTVLAGSYGNGLFRSTDGGASWSHVDAGLTAPALRCFVPGPDGALLAGTEPARIFRSEDAGASWRELDGITRIAGHERWFLPYSPRAGAVRNVYSPPGRPRRLLASVEVGGLITSDDGGASWAIGPVIADEDIHVVTGHPQDPDVLYVALGSASVTPPPAGERLAGVARSRDGGASWEKVETDYTRALIVPPVRPDLLLAAPARRVGRGGRIVVSGRRRRHVGAGVGRRRDADAGHGRAVRRRPGRRRVGALLAGPAAPGDAGRVALGVAAAGRARGPVDRVRLAAARLRRRVFF